MCPKSKNEIPKNAIPVSDDYYLNANGQIVFTETFHLKRGYCCHNNCFHCPYGEESDAAKKSN